jgi:hypothetical protein
MSEEIHPIVALTDDQLAAKLLKAVRSTLILGAILAAVLGISSGWRNAAMMMTGAAISAASILEWRRLIGVINAKMDKKKTPRGAFLAVLFLVLRLTVFTLAIYGSLKCFQGSVAALLCGLGLAVLAVGWEVLQLLKD